MNNLRKLKVIVGFHPCRFSIQQGSKNGREILMTPILSPSKIVSKVRVAPRKTVKLRNPFVRDTLNDAFIQ